MHRLLHRSLLSLLMVWQLLASVVAHPLPVQMNAADTTHHSSSVVSMQSDCPHQHQAAQSQAHQSHQESNHKTSDEHACHAACKCPCAGTPALVFTLPTLPTAITEAPLARVELHNPPVALVANLLRPPIA